ncbi:hypothetical protein CJ030_MR2G029004 [Morella rubra]|uniref:Uncharacterized protein n=1 Tax=Morella rubra TaxID=262757 RepID=A0A6A1VHF7_9ROSI|nr:hypothetical protein CJ030_MR6G010816 [Morella rubra]KAB1222763.1 hypothetical protein CJ030_MR2G029004 [Morella rubra]
MPELDPRAGNAFISIIFVFLFLCLAAGGGCLVIYTTQPNPSSWLEFAGVAFVCLPWLFWLLTCFYRVISRTCGSRFVVRRDGGGEGGGCGGPCEGDAPAGGGSPHLVNAAEDMATGAGIVETSVRSPEIDARRRAQFEAILALDDDQDCHGSSEGKDKRNLTSPSNSSKGSSVASHESEQPLASSMVS